VLFDLKLGNDKGLPRVVGLGIGETVTVICKTEVTILLTVALTDESADDSSVGIDRLGISKKGDCVAVTVLEELIQRAPEEAADEA
jgi:hypothetical protein